MFHTTRIHVLLCNSGCPTASEHLLRNNHWRDTCVSHTRTCGLQSMLQTSHTCPVSQQGQLCLQLECAQAPSSCGDTCDFFTTLIVLGGWVSTLHIRAHRSDDWSVSLHCLFPCFVCSLGWLLQVEVCCGPFFAVSKEGCCGVVVQHVEASEKWLCNQPPCVAGVWSHLFYLRPCCNNRVQVRRASNILHNTGLHSA